MLAAMVKRVLVFLEWRRTTTINAKEIQGYSTRSHRYKPPQQHLDDSFVERRCGFLTRTMMGPPSPILAGARHGLNISSRWQAACLSRDTKKRLLPTSSVEDYVGTPIGVCVDGSIIHSFNFSLWAKQSVGPVRRLECSIIICARSNHYNTRCTQIIWSLTLVGGAPGNRMNGTSDTDTHHAIDTDRSHHQLVQHSTSSSSDDGHDVVFDDPIQTSCEQQAVNPVHSSSNTTRASQAPFSPPVRFQHSTPLDDTNDTAVHCSIPPPIPLDPFQRSTPSAFRNCNAMQQQEHASIEVTASTTFQHSKNRVFRRRRKPAAPIVTIVQGDRHVDLDDDSPMTRLVDHTVPLDHPVVDNCTSMTSSWQLISATDREVMELTDHNNRDVVSDIRPKPIHSFKGGSPREGASMALDRFFVDRVVSTVSTASCKSSSCASTMESPPKFVQDDREDDETTIVVIPDEFPPDTIRDAWNESIEVQRTPPVTVILEQE